MASPATRFVFAILTFVTVGMIIGALLQLAYIRRLEDPNDTESSSRRLSETQNGGGIQFIQGICHWEDKEALILRLGYVKPEIISWSPRIIIFQNFLSTEFLMLARLNKMLCNFFSQVFRKERAKKRNLCDDPVAEDGAFSKNNETSRE